jgi:hypothetical protein
LRPKTILFLSRKDDPKLQTFDDIVNALPPRVRLLILDDVEYLLPPGQRQPERVRRYLIGLKARHSHRGFHVVAHMWKAKPVGFRREILP